MTLRILAMTIALLGCLMPFSASPAYAQAQTDGTVKLTNPLDPSGNGGVTVSVLTGRIIKAMLGLVGSIAFLMFVWGGFNWLISGGSAEKVEKGKKAMVYATIGLLIVFASYALVTFVLSAFTGAS